MINRRPLLLFILVLWAVFNASTKCLKEYSGISYKRSFYYNGMSLPVVIESSDRASHLFVNNILYILITEVLKYKAVKIVHRDHPTDYVKIVKRLSNLSEDGVPQTMVNMEVWFPHNFEINSENIIEAGSLGLVGMFGWFVPSGEVENLWKNFGVILNHWRSLTKFNISKLFSWDAQNVHSNSINPSGGTWCDIAHDRCPDGIFIVNKSLCSGSHDHNCAILFSSYPDVDRGAIVDQIRKHGLLSNIAWVGENLKALLNKVLQASRPIVFFNWTPNDVTSISEFDIIQFPQHFKQSSQDLFSKQYMLKKIVWKVIKSHLPDVHQVISQLQFDEGELKHELSKFPMKWTDSIVHQLACDWLKNNPIKWKPWLPLNPVRKTPIHLAGLFPKSFPSIKEGARMAVEALNDDKNILKDYELHLHSITVPCDPDGSTMHFMRAIHNNTSKQPIAIIGPTCYEAAEPLVSLSTFFNKLVISFGSDISWRGRRLGLESFFDVMPDSSVIGDIYISIVKTFNWSQIAVIMQDDDQFKQRSTFVKESATLNFVNVIYESTIDSEFSDVKLIEVLQGLKSIEVRVIVLLSDKELSLRLLCLSMKMGLSVAQGYVWFVMQGLIGLENEPTTEQCSTAEQFQALSGCLVVRPSLFGPLEKTISISGGLTIADWKDLYQARLDALAMQESVYGTYAFDAVLTLGLALDNLIREDPSSIEAIGKSHILRKFTWHVRNLRMTGVTGSVSFGDSQRIGCFDVGQIQENGSLYIIGRFDFSKNSSASLELNESTIMMFHPALLSLKRFGPHSCSVESFRALMNVDCDVAIGTINVVCLFVLSIFAIGCLIFIKKRYDIKVRATCDRMEELGLFSQDTSWLCLDQWEVPRDNVVLNRKLGEGAFGTVFGGEANIGSVWVAAAVKTLKLSSKPDEKLDFLSEAEMMKRFSHENIVKLLGVCTRGEPTLAIMEFMLHGDLKTFLLSRRQLVGQPGREAEDVSPMQLTKMALDVAHGLLYLSALNYVHRDLACRNCLVHANKAVKIGDFGMTRSMNDSDYYRFNKRGMFPVRWMAPESLSDGLFGTPSDVWSYGVLLYEIITFGSFPYQGLSNRQVLNFVKNGNILSMPAECPPKVESLLKRCWTFDPKNRPKVIELIEVLTEMPLLLTPCLDTPSTSVNTEGPWSLEMNLLPRVRHRNQYQKNLIVSDRMSAPSSTNDPSTNFNSSRLSSPPFCHDVDNVTSTGDEMEASKHEVDSYNLTGLAELKRLDHQGSGNNIQCEMDESFLSQDTEQLCHASIRQENKAKDRGLPSVKRSLSADDKTIFDAKLWGNVSSKICRLYADKIRSKIEEMKRVERRENEKSGIKRRTLMPILSVLGEQEGFATEPRQNNRKSVMGPQQLTCDSRTDSDYCSQHSKDFSAHIGTALL